MKLFDCSIDDDVEVYVDAGRLIINAASAMRIFGTVVASLQRPGAKLLGWKDPASAPSGGIPAIAVLGGLTFDKVSSNISNYSMVQLFGDELTIAGKTSFSERPTRKIQAVKITYGHFCSRCNDYNEYAAHDAEAGPFTCYRCRNH